MRISSLAVMVTSAAGAALSLYALHVRRSLKDVNYKPFCDISQTVACSGVLGGPHARPLSYLGLVKEGSFFDFSTATFAFVFYFLMSTFPFGRRKLRGAYLGASAVSVIISSVLAYALASRFHKLCLVCAGISMANCAIFGAILAARPHKERVRPVVPDQKRKRG